MTNNASPSANVESSPGTYKIMTIIATVLCLCLLGASIFLGSGAHSQSTKAAQTRSDTESLRANKKDGSSLKGITRALHRSAFFLYEYPENRKSQTRHCPSGFPIYW